MIRVGEVAALLREWGHRLLGTLMRRGRSDDDLAREIAFHIEQTELQLRSRGHSAQEAHRLARALSGNPDGAVEAMRTQGGVPWVGAFTLDVTLGFRMLRKYWGLSLVGGLALAIVIGICTAVFLYFNVFWSTALPIEDGERVVAIQLWDASARRRAETSLDDFERWRDRMESLENVGAFRTIERNLVADGRAGERVAVAEMSAAGFRVARTAPLIGRGIVADDERPDALPIAVIGYDEWQRRFAGDPNVLGRTLRLDDAFHTIVGVMPASFGFPLNHRLWIPLRADAGGRLPAPPLGSVFARLAPGFQLHNAQAELTTMGLLPDNNVRAQDTTPPRLLVLPYAQNFIDDMDPAQYGSRTWIARLAILLMSLLLIPPGLNIAMLVYARTTTRQQEIAVRTALGASRRRIVVQLFVEMLVLAALAALVALAGVWLVAWYLEQLLVRQLVDLPFWIDVGMSAEAILLAATLAVMAALLMGFVPALRATRQFARPGLGGLSSRARLGPFWTALIVAQVGFSFAMLPVALEIAWGTLREHLLGPGFPSAEYLSAQLSFDTDASAQFGDEPGARADAFALAQEELFRRARAVPGVVGSTLVSAVPGTAPLAGVELETNPAPEGQPVEANWWNSVTRTMQVDAAFFETFEARPLAGRLFTGDEFADSSRSIVVSQRFVERTLHGASPLGLRLRYARPRGAADDVSIEQPWYEIVGVVPDIPAHAYDGTVYHPLARAGVREASVVMRLAPGTPAFGRRLAEMAATTTPPLRVSEVRTLAEVYSAQAFGNYIGGFALIAGTLSVLLLAAAGTYALMSFTVNDRRREIGVRVALGAPKTRLLGGVLKRALRQILAGAAVGVAVALFIENKLPAGANGALDIPGVLPIAASFMVLVALLATLGPARRALRLDPNEALRDVG